MTPVRWQGQALVEFALVGGMFLLLVLGTFDVARAYLGYTVAANAANEAARYGAAHLDEPGWEAGAVQAAVNLAVGVDVAALTVVPIETSLGDLPAVAVRVTYAFHPVVPGVSALVGDPLTMVVNAVAPAG
jgi:hypothetical protein